MNDLTIVAIGITFVQGLMIGVFALPAGRWLGGGIVGKLAALLSVVMGFYTATLILILFRIEIAKVTPYPPGFVSTTGYWLWWGIGLGSGCLYMFAFRWIMRRIQNRRIILSQ